MRTLFTLKTLSISFFLLLLSTSYAQNSTGWIQDGAKWKFKQLHSLNGLIDIQYQGTVVIGNIQFQKLSASKRDFYPQSNGGFIEGNTVELDDLLFHTSNDSVFIRKEDGALQFVWYLNPQVGDVWSFGTQIDALSGVSGAAFSLVESVQTLVINGVQTKQIKTVPCVNQLGTIPDLDDTIFVNYYGNEINSVLGPITYFLETGDFYSHPSPNAVDLFGSELLCYESDVIPSYRWDEEIDCNNGYLSLNELKNEKYVLSPNPARSSFAISNLDKIKEYSILDLKGNLVLKSSIFPCDVSNFQKGMYFVEFQTKENLFYHSKLLVE